jgi:hypothetical protein
VWKFLSYSEGVERLTCSCDVLFSNINDPNFVCHPVTWDAMQKISTSRSKKECLAVSQHQCHNAFSNIETGDHLYKIFGVVPTDSMHLVCKGYDVLSYVIVFDYSHGGIPEVQAG